MSESRVTGWADGPPAVDPDTIDLSQPHLVGVHGELMGPLTQILALVGCRATVNDQRMRPDLPELFRTTALKVSDGRHRTSCVIYSTAIPDDHPDLVTARATGVPLVHRAQALDVLLRGKAGGFLEHVQASIGVTGSHGKTTTAAMIGWILREADTGPVCLMGGRWADTDTAAYAGYGDTLVAEIDESDRSHLLSHPDVAVIPALGHAHPETYRDMADVHDTMLRWACGLPHDATVILSADDPGTAALAASLRDLPFEHRIITYGTAPGADVPVVGLSTGWAGVGCTVRFPGEEPLYVQTSGPGVHRVRNAVAAIIAARLRGIDPRRAAEALLVFPGVKRRWQFIGAGREVSVVDSYASHPTEISADLSAARALAGPASKVLVAFQPSGLARLAAFGPQIGDALAADVDLTLLLPVHTRYPDPTPERVDRLRSQLAQQLAGACELVLAASDRAVDAKTIADAARPGDVIVTMGTGDVTDLAPRIVRALTALTLNPGRTQPRRRPRRARHRP